MRKYTDMKLIFATNNAHKIKEVKALLPANIEIITLKDAGITEDIPEPYETFHENAMTKALYISEKTGMNCMSEDSGICVAALDGRPGVFSARYAGEPTDDERNLQKLLSELSGIEQRTAYYNATVALIWDGKSYLFDGQCHGNIAEEKEGKNGFGYDPIFIPTGYQETFGELENDVKATISHRKVAIEKMAAFMNYSLNTAKD